MKNIGSRNSFDRDVPAIERLVMTFHQEFGLMEINPYKAGEQFFAQISRAESEELAAQIKDMLTKFPGKDQNGLRNEWLRKGAQWWDKKFDLRETLKSWVERLKAQ